MSCLHSRMDACDILSNFAIVKLTHTTMIPGQLIQHIFLAAIALETERKDFAPLSDLVIY